MNTPRSIAVISGSEFLFPGLLAQIRSSMPNAKVREVTATFQGLYRGFDAVVIPFQDSPESAFLHKAALAFPHAAIVAVCYGEIIHTQFDAAHQVLDANKLSPYLLTKTIDFAIEKRLLLLELAGQSCCSQGLQVKRNKGEGVPSASTEMQQRFHEVPVPADILMETISGADLADYTDDVIWRIDSEFRLVNANNAFFQMVKGYYNVEVSPGDFVLDPAVFGYSNLDDWRSLYTEAMAGKLTHKEIETKGPGITTWCEVSFMPIKSGDVITGVACHSRNITESRKACEELKTANDKLHLLLDNTTDWFLVTDTELNIVTFNRAAQEYMSVFGKRPLKTGAPLLSYGPADKREELRAIYNKVLSGEARTRKLTQGEGAVKVVFELLYKPLLDSNGSVIGMMITAQNITKEERVLEEMLEKHRQLQVAEEKTRQLFENTNEGIYIHEIGTGRIMDVNKRACELIGFSRHDLMQGSSKLFGVPGYTIEKAREYLRKAETEGPQQFEWTTIHSNGSPVWMEVTLKRANIAGTDRILAFSRDITDRKKDEAKMQEALLENKKIMDASLDVICSIDLDGCFVKVSKAAEAVWGYTADELKGRKYIDMVFAGDHEKTNAASAEIMSGVAMTNFENRYVRKDGMLVPVLWSAKWDEHDQLMYCIAKDASEKKHLEKVLEYEQNQYREIFNAAPVSIGLLQGPEHRFIIANPHYHELTGKRHIINRMVKDVFPEIADQGFIEILDNVYRTGETYVGRSSKITIWRDDSDQATDLYLDFTYQPYRDPEGNVQGIFFFAVDVSGQVEARNKIEESQRILLKSEANLRSILDNSNVAYTMLDTEMRIVSFNQLAYSGTLKMQGLHLEAGREFKNYVPSDRQIMLETEYKEVLAGKPSSDTITFLHQGKEHIYSINRYPVYANDNSIIGVLLAMENITDRIEAERLLEQQNIELRKTNEELDRFVYSASHDLRAPLISVLGLLNLARAEKSENVLVPLYDMMEGSINKLDRFIHDIVNYSRNTRLDIIPEKLEFKTLVNGCIDQLRYLEGARFITITDEVTGDAPFYTDKARVTVLLNNLLSNAIKYHNVSRPGAYIKFKAHQTNEKCIITVSDNGNGIQVGSIDKIFEMFYRGSESSSGSGLGLYIVKEIVEKLSGTISVQSELMKGTTFTIELPNSLPE